MMIYFAIADLNRKATINANPLVIELDEKDNYISIDVHSVVDLKNVRRR